MRVESTNSQDARVEALWKTFDTDHHGYLNITDLRRGLRRLDHRMLIPGGLFVCLNGVNRCL
jgi:Ca2+-binding EF-hand superfamily protein